MVNLSLVVNYSGEYIRTPLIMKSISARQGMFESSRSGNLLLCSGQVF